MADIDQIIAGGAGASSRADFSGLSKIFDSYYKGRDEFAKNDLRDAFKGGVPTLPDGSIDYATMQRTLYQKGALDQGNSLSGISARAGELEALRGADSAQPPIVSPPSANRSASAVVAPPLNKGGVAQPSAPQSAPQSSPGGDQPGSIVGAVSAAGIPDELAGPVIAQLSALAKTDPNVPLPPDMAQRIQQVAQAAAQRMKTGQAPQPTGIQPQQAAPQAPPIVAQAQPAAPQAAPQGFQPPPNVVAAQNDPILKRLTLLSASQDKQIAAAAKVRLESYLKNQELTPDEKNARASGMSVQDYQNRGDENKAQLAILEKSVLPKMDESHKAATAARDEIQAIHRSREQLDAPGGIFSGTASEVRLKLAKAAELIGVPNADKIANTEAFSAAIGSRVLALVKGLGSGTSISNSDRAFAEKMAGGNINLDETSIRKILEIGERAARAKIDTHNTTAGKIISSNEALKPYTDVYRVEAPGQYERPKGGKGQSAAAGFPEAKKAPDGNFYVPDPARPGKYLRVVQ
jgi:hypothetical protein